MDKKEAVESITKIQQMTNQYISKETIAAERHIDTSQGRIRVLEYGFGSDDVKPYSWTYTGADGASCSWNTMRRSTSAYSRRPA